MNESPLFDQNFLRNENCNLNSSYLLEMKINYVTLSNSGEQLPITSSSIMGNFFENQNLSVDVS